VIGGRTRGRSSASPGYSTPLPGRRPAASTRRARYAETIRKPRRLGARVAAPRGDPIWRSNLSI